MIDQGASAIRRPDEFRDRVSPHLASMFQEARRVVHSDDLAWDAVQESLVRLWQGPEWAEDDGFKWRAARLSQLRGRQARRSYERRCRHERMAAQTRCPDCGLDPSAVAASNEAESRVRRALSELPADLRRVLTLRAVDELDYSQIAMRLNVPLGTVRSRLARARECLKTRLTAEMRSAG